MTDTDKANALDWLNEIVTNPKYWRMFYSDSETKTCAEATLAMLKEHEAVKPKSKVRHGANAQVQHFCGNCMMLLHGKPKYCSECGKKVYWHGRQ